MLIIPAIDIIDNNVVRLSKGDYDKSTIYGNSVVDQVKIYKENNFNWIHIVDLIGSKTGVVNVFEIIKSVKKLDVKIEFGGGIRKLEDVDKLIEFGVDKVILGSISVNNKNEFEKIVSKYSDDKIITAVDVNGEKIAVKGWTEKSDLSIYDHINYCKALGLNTYLCTDIARDGMLTGPSFELYEKLQNTFSSINIITSGGISNIDDIIKLMDEKYFAVVVGRAIYENKINLKELADLVD